MTKSAAILHAVLFTVAIIAYVVLTVLGHDGNPVFLLFAGQASGAAIQTATNASENANGNPPENSGLKIAPDRSTIK